MKARGTSLVGLNERRATQSSAFLAQPEGLGLFFHSTSLLAAYIHLVHCAISALLSKKITSSNDDSMSVNRP